MRAVTVKGIFCCVFVLVALTVARGELLLDNFTAANPLRIMPVGDSITDDCVTNGAWRAPLEPLLQGAGIAFTNTGRLFSGGYPGFSETRHEGYCGSVIGPPGVFAVHNYTTTDAYLQRIVSDALANTNNLPDLLLILIGANDIGRGRNPRYVATNDMPILLDIIFSNAPDAHVVLAKTSTLRNAILGYNLYASNVPLYNAALQAMVNQRRKQGDNVFLADMFSAVDYATMFLSDHLHPNPLGLKAIAEEWATRLETISIRSDRITSLLIHGGAEWKYLDTGEDLRTNWTLPDFDDSEWSQGPARLGYGESTVATRVSFGSSPTNRIVTTYFRREFVVPGNAVITNLNFRLARTGGAVVWLNGRELFRVNMPEGQIFYTNLALTTVTGEAGQIFYPTNIPISGLATGTNLVALELHQSSPVNPFIGFDMELIGSGELLPAPVLSVSAANTNIVLSWPLTNGAGFALYSSTNLAQEGSWGIAPTEMFTNGSQIVATQAVDSAGRYFRLRR